MALDTWIGGAGDWNDPSNWFDGAVPSPTDSVVFPANTSVTLWGAAFVGALDVDGGDVDVAGDFGPDGQDPASVTDLNAGTQSPPGTLSIAYWASLSLDNLQLGTTELVVNGLLLTQNALVAVADVDGPNSAWLAGDATVTQSMSIANSATVEGSVVLESGAVLSLDPTSSLEDGTVVVEGPANLDLMPASTGMPEENTAFMDNIMLATGSTLTLSNGASNDYLAYDAAISGAGTFALVDTNAVFLSQATIGSSIEIQAGTATVAASSISSTASFILSSGVLDLRAQAPESSTEIVDVDCISGMNTIYSGSNPLDILDSGVAPLSFITGNGGTITTSGEQVVIKSKGGSGSIAVTADSSAVSRSESSGSQDYPVGQISVSGSASTTIKVGDGSADIFGQLSSGNNEYFGGTGNGITAIYDGSGNDTVIGGSSALDVHAGSGPLLVWGGTSGDDTITGGVGADTLVGGQGATVVGVGDMPDLLGDYASNALLDASQTDGEDTIFGGAGTGVTTVLGGYGNDVVVGGSATLDVICGSGNTSVWGAGATGDTILGGLGNDLLQGGLSSSIALVGSGKDTVLAQAGISKINATSFAGSGLIFCGGSGVSTIKGGNGEVTVVGTGGSLAVSLGSGSAEIWAAQDRYDTIVGGNGNNTLVAGYGDILEAAGAGENVLISASSNVTLNSDNATGSTTFFLSGSENNTVIAGSGQNVIVASAGSCQIVVNGGSDQVWLGSGDVSLDIVNSSSIGTLLIFGYNPSIDVIGVSDSSLNVDVAANYTVFKSNNETVLLWGFEGQPITHT